MIPKHERRFTGFDDKIIAMYARGMTVREIQAFLGEMYGMEVSPDFISTVTDAVIAEVTAWQARPLEPMYPVVFFDAVRVKIRDERCVRSKAVYLALAILPDGTRDVLGLWIEQTEGAKFWLKVFNDLKTRGCQDILIAVTDGLKGMSEASTAVYPETTLQTCIVHLIRNSLDYASWKERKPVAAGAAADLHGGERRSRADARWTRLSRDRGASSTRPSWRRWRRAWEHVMPFFAFPPGDPPRHLHDQRHRERQHAASEDHQDPRSLPERRGRHQAAVAGAAQHHVRHSVRAAPTGKPP